MRYALLLLLIWAGIGLLACATSASLHSWGDGRSPWIDYGDECSVNCST